MKPDCVPAHLMANDGECISSLAPGFVHTGRNQGTYTGEAPPTLSPVDFVPGLLPRTRMLIFSDIHGMNTHPCQDGLRNRCIRLY